MRTDVKSLVNIEMVGRWHGAIRGSFQPTIGWYLLAALFVIGCADFTADYCHLFGVPYRDYLPGLKPAIDKSVLALIAALGALGVIRKSLRQAQNVSSEWIKAFGILLFSSTVLGATVGLVKGANPAYVFGDSQNIIIYLIFFAVSSSSPKFDLKGSMYIFFLGGCVLFGKILLSVGSDILIGYPGSWRYLLRLSWLFPPMLLVSAALFIGCAERRSRRKYLLLMIASGFGLFAAQMRGHFLGSIVGLIFLAIFYRRSGYILRFLLMVTVIGALGYLMTFVMDVEKRNMFGHWSNEHFAVGMEYRQRQTEMLRNRFIDNWAFGAGLGTFDEFWEGHEDWLPRPYLVELEYHNLLAKLGVVGFTLFLGAFASLLRACAKTSRMVGVSSGSRALLRGMAAGLIAMMTASGTNTVLSSAYFHVYVVLILIVEAAIRRLALKPENLILRRLNGSEHNNCFV